MTEINSFGSITNNQKKLYVENQWKCSPDGMNYLQWNNAIGKCLFNEEKAEQEVHLFITKYDICKIGRENEIEGTDEEIFSNYIKSIRRGIPGKPLRGSILDHAIYAFEKWKKNPIRLDGVDVKYPLYLGYLSLFVLPLTQNNQTNLRHDAYYPIIRAFLAKHELPPMPSQNESCNWNALWKDLEEWSILEKNTSLGFFELHPFSHQSWIYVGKPLSQSILPIQAIRQLPQFFQKSGLVPQDDLNISTLRKILVQTGQKQLGLSSRLINVIKNPENELGHSILDVIKKNYQDWTGITDQYDAETDSIKKGNTVAQLRLCFEGDSARGYKFYYRLYTKLDFPEDLSFTFDRVEYKCLQYGKGWSKPLFLPALEEIDVRDSLNKWKAKLPAKDIRFFIEGKNFHLNGWVEVPSIVSTKMILMAKKELSNSIEEWGQCFAEGDFKELTTIKIFGNFVFYQLNNPPIGHPDIPALQFKSEKKIALTGGIKIGVRTWLNKLLPDIELENGRGTEKIYLTYSGSEDRSYLTRKNIDQPVWSLPPNILINKEFNIKVDGEDVKGAQLKNYIINSTEILKSLDEDILPARDKFGQIINREGYLEFVIGSRCLTPDERKYSLRQNHYNKDFKPFSTQTNKLSCSDDINSYQDLLVTFLTVKNVSNAKDYFEVFETIYQNRFDPNEIESHPIELSRLKRWSLNYLDFMGILDYEYSTKKIVVVPPQFLLIPTISGRKVCLIGGRTEESIKKICEEAEKEGLYLNFQQQHLSLSPFLLPPTVTISGFDEIDGNKIETKIKKVAEACSVTFDPGKFPQFRLSEFSGNIGEYVEQLKPDERFDDSGWPAKIFDPFHLRFIPVDIKMVDKSYSLVEYRLTEYSFKHRIWKDGQSYAVDKNWARYMILNYFEKEVIFNDREKNIVAIPATLPLPRIINQAMTLYSGKAPLRKFATIEGLKTWFNIYKNLPHVIAYNTFLKVGQRMKETSIEI